MYMDGVPDRYLLPDICTSSHRHALSLIQHRKGALPPATSILRGVPLPFDATLTSSELDASPFRSVAGSFQLCDGEDCFWCADGGRRTRWVVLVVVVVAEGIDAAWLEAVQHCYAEPALYCLVDLSCFCGEVFLVHSGGVLAREDLL